MAKSRRRTSAGALAALALLLVGFVGLLSAAGPGRSQMVICTATRAHLAVGDAARKNLTLLNAGTIHANVGWLAHAQTGFQGMTLHAGTAMEFRDFQSGIECQTAGGSTAVEVLEEMK